MRNVLTRSIFCLYLFQASISACSTVSSHLTELKSKYPYGLLNDDFWVLSLNDLALNACRVNPSPFVPGNLNPYEYWICFESKKILAVCEDQGFSNEDGRVGRVIIDAKDCDLSYHFFESRPWSIQDCMRFVTEVNNLVSGTSHACISASYIDKEDMNDKGQKERKAIFHRIKTNKGCEGENCVFTEKVKKENCPDFKS